MPTYEYRCRACGEHHEVVQSFSDDPLTDCPACGGELRKVFGNVGIVFKGSGFYKTDSRGGTSASTNSEPAGAASSTGSGEKGAAGSAAPSTPSTDSGGGSSGSSGSSDKPSGAGTGTSSPAPAAAAS